MNIRQIFLIIVLLLAMACNDNKTTSIKEETAIEKKIQIVAINGSPRKDGNTATLCKRFLEGAASASKDVEITLFNLYDLDFKGCTSCFACKLADSDCYGRCAMEDDLTPVLEKIATADGVAIGSPIYFGEITGELRSFLERLLFPYVTYEASRRTLAPKRFPTVCFYTMNVTEEGAKKNGYFEYFDKLEKLIERVFSKPERICAYNTYQFTDYQKYKADAFDEKDKRKHKETQFPIDCQKAFDAGKKMAKSLIIKSMLNKHSLILASMDGKIITYDDNGIKPLFNHLKNSNFQKFDVYDKITGKASALILIYGGAKQLYTNVLSKEAIPVLEKYGVNYHADTIVDYIQNIKKDDKCPMEKAVANIDEPQKGFEILQQKFN